MSIEYKAIYGMGYHISGDMITNMDTDLFEEFVEDDFTYVIDDWRGGDDYFFGIEITRAYEGEIDEVPFHEYTHEDFRAMVEAYHHYFPEVHQVPRHYLIHQVY